MQSNYAYGRLNQSRQYIFPFDIFCREKEPEEETFRLFPMEFIDIMSLRVSCYG